MGNLKPVEKGFGRRTFNRIIAAFNANYLLIEGRPGWSRTKDGVLPPPAITPGEAQGKKLWSLAVEDEDTAEVKLLYPGTIKRTSALDNSGNVTITDVESTFTVTVGDFLLLEYGRDLQVTLKKDTNWTGWPFTIESEEISGGSGGYKMAKNRYPLWMFVSEENASDFAIRINDNIYADKVGYDTNLQFVLVRAQDKDGNVISAYELQPSLLCQTWAS